MGLKMKTGDIEKMINKKPGGPKLAAVKETVTNYDAATWANSVNVLIKHN